MSEEQVPEVGLEPTCPKGQRILNPHCPANRDSATNPDADASCEGEDGNKPSHGTRVQENADPCRVDSDQSASGPSKASLDFVLGLWLEWRRSGRSAIRFASSGLAEAQAEAADMGWLHIYENPLGATKLELTQSGIDAAYYHDHGQVLGEARQ